MLYVGIGCDHNQIGIFTDREVGNFYKGIFQSMSDF